MTKIEYFTRSLNRMVSAAESRRESFLKSFTESPSYALSWSKDLFEYEAKASVAKYLLSEMERAGDKVTIANLNKMVLRYLRSKSRYPSMSTSPTSNLMDQYELAAWSEVSETLDDLENSDD